MHKKAYLSLSKEKTILFSALRKAGSLARRTIDRANKVLFKNNSPIDLVTWVDKAADRLIVDTIREQFPDHEFLTEESYPTIGSQSKASYRWIVDPIDGTTNFAHHFPQACTSIGLEHEGTIILGGVYDPFRDELFWAAQGQGAHIITKRRTHRIHVSQTSRLRQSLLITGFPYDRRKHADLYLSYIKAFMGTIQGIRRLGAAALDMCWIACGRADGYWEWRLKPWDCSAGKIIVEEAGGRLSDFTGGPYSIYGTQTLATNGKVHREMVKIMKRLER